MWISRLRSSALLLALLAPSAHAASLYRIACGSSTGGTDALGHVWQSDAFFTGGADYSRADMAALGLPYKALRNGNAFSYTLPAPNGDYLVKLHYVEVRTAASTVPISAGQRQMAVSIAGSPVVQVVASPLDLFAVAGSMMPYVITVPVSVLNGTLAITHALYAPGSLAALLSGIEVDSVDPPPPPVVPTVTYLTGLESAAPACPASGLTLFLATDTNHLFRCFNGGAWTVVGDVRNADVPPAPALVKLEECKGSGQGWNCAGIYRALVKLVDSTVLPIVGTAYDASASSAVWIAKQ